MLPPISPIPAFRLPQWLSLEVALLIPTLIISLAAYRSQLRSDVRESIEQIPEIELDGTQKIIAVLHHFSWRLSSRFSISTIAVQQYDSGVHVAGPSKPGDYYFNNKSKAELDAIEDTIKQMSYIKSVKASQDGLLVKCNTVNPVRARRIAERSLRTVREAARSAEDEYPDLAEKVYGKSDSV